MISDLQTILDIQSNLDDVACGFDPASVELRSLWIEAIFC